MDFKNIKKNKVKVSNYFSFLLYTLTVPILNKIDADFEYTLACGCHLNGSKSQQCNEITGVCTCKNEHIGGIKCDDCHLPNKYGPECIGISYFKHYLPNHKLVKSRRFLHMNRHFI